MSESLTSWWNSKYFFRESFYSKEYKFSGNQRERVFVRLKENFSLDSLKEQFALMVSIFEEAIKKKEDECCVLKKFIEILRKMRPHHSSLMTSSINLSGTPKISEFR